MAPVAVGAAGKSLDTLAADVLLPWLGFDDDLVVAPVAVGAAGKSVAMLAVADALLPWLGFDDAADDIGALPSMPGELVVVWRRGDLRIEN